MKTQTQTTTKNNKPLSDKAFAFKRRWRGRHQTLGVLKNSFSIINHKAYRYYLDNSKLANREDISGYSEHGRIISMFYKEVGQKIVEADGGVFIEGLGYFGIIQEMNKKMFMDKRTGNKMFNPKTDNIIYNIGFVPITKDNVLKPWVFDYSFTQAIKKSLSEKLKAGKKYTFNASLFFNKLRKTGNNL
jgi:hypothetical protein